MNIFAVFILMGDEGTMSCYELLILLKDRKILDESVNIDIVMHNLFTTISRPDELLNCQLYGQNIGLFKIIVEDRKMIRCCVCYKNIEYVYQEVVRHIESEDHKNKLLHEFKRQMIANHK